MSCLKFSFSASSLLTLLPPKRELTPSAMAGGAVAPPPLLLSRHTRRNKAIQELAARDPENETTQLLCQQIYDLARMSAQPLEADEITAFLKRSQKLVAMAVEKE